MLNFVAAAQASQEGFDHKRPADDAGDLTPDELRNLTTLVIRRFIQQVEWESITDIYLGGLVSDADLELIKGFVRRAARDITVDIKPVSDE